MMQLFFKTLYIFKKELDYVEENSEKSFTWNVVIFAEDVGVMDFSPLLLVFGFSFLFFSFDR